MRRIVDISVPLRAGIASDPPGLLPEIDYFDHHETADDVLAFFPGATRADLPDEEGWALERVRISTHNGTHLDAPWHFSPDDGRRPARHHHRRGAARLVLPARRVKLDFRHFAGRLRGHRQRRRGASSRASATTWQPLEIVVVNTARRRSATASDDYVGAGCGMGREATLYLLERGVRVTGTDAWSWDAPFVHTAQALRRRPATPS